MAKTLYVFDSGVVAEVYKYQIPAMIIRWCPENVKIGSLSVNGAYGFEGDVKDPLTFSKSEVGKVLRVATPDDLPEGEYDKIVNGKCPDTF